MNRANRTSRERPYRIKKTGIKDENIDRQILVLHKAMGEKLLKNPEQLQQIKKLLEERREKGQIGYGAYITWFSLLSLSDDKDKFMQALLEDSAKMRRLRRTTPLIGVLTECERQQALAKCCCGTTSIETML